MAWFADLSPYTYSAFALPGTVNVGWLEPGNPYPVGAVPAAFLARLAEMCEGGRVNSARGPHLCGLCPPGAGWCGSSQLHVAGSDGVVYAAPILILHYVRDHGYRPPAEFVAAVADGVWVNPEPQEPAVALALAIAHRDRRRAASGAVAADFARRGAGAHSEPKK